MVIPDIINRNVFDIYKPRVSKATLNRIEDFFHNLISPLLKITVINPEYEEVLERTPDNLKRSNSLSARHRLKLICDGLAESKFMANTSDRF